MHKESWEKHLVQQGKAKDDTRARQREDRPKCRLTKQCKEKM